MGTEATRLLVLGAVRQEQPASGYAIMRELASWGVEDWASINPGSIYGALRALTKDGLTIHADGGTPAGGRAHRNSAKFRLGDEGESMFFELLRGALWEVHVYDATPFMAALCFLTELQRDEVSAAIAERLTGLESNLKRLKFDTRQNAADPKTPPHAVEFLGLTAGRIRGEVTFTRGLLDRVASGRYTFYGESS